MENIIIGTAKTVHNAKRFYGRDDNGQPYRVPTCSVSLYSNGVMKSFTKTDAAITCKTCQKAE